MMPFRVSGQQRNYLFLTISGVILAAIVVAGLIGSSQDRGFLQNYQRYQQATALLGEKKYSQALQNFNTLDSVSQGSYQVLYMSAFCELQTGDYEASARHMQMAREARPALVQDQKYLFRYGVILFNMGDFQQSALYLNESIKYPDDTGTVREARNYLAVISKQQGGGR